MDHLSHEDVYIAETSPEEWDDVRNTIHTLCNMVTSQNSILYITLDVIFTAGFSVSKLNNI